MIAPRVDHPELSAAYGVRRRARCRPWSDSRHPAPSRTRRTWEPYTRRQARGMPPICLDMPTGATRPPLSVRRSRCWRCKIRGSVRSHAGSGWIRRRSPVSCGATPATRAGQRVYGPEWRSGRRSRLETAEAGQARHQPAAADLRRTQTGRSGHRRRREADRRSERDGGTHVVRTDVGVASTTGLGRRALISSPTISTQNRPIPAPRSARPLRDLSVSRPAHPWLTHGTGHCAVTWRRSKAAKKPGQMRALVPGVVVLSTGLRRSPPPGRLPRRLSSRFHAPVAPVSVSRWEQLVLAVVRDATYRRSASRRSAWYS